MLNKAELKKLVGEEIYIIPQSNAINRGKPLNEQIQKVLLVKVSPVNVVLEGVSYPSSVDKYPIEGTDSNSHGYLYFKNLEEAEGYFFTGEVTRALYNVRYLTLQQARDINEILNLV